MISYRTCVDIVRAMFSRERWREAIRIYGHYDRRENTYLISGSGTIGVRSYEIDHGRPYGDVVVQRNGTRHRREHRWNVVYVLCHV